MGVGGASVAAVGHEGDAGVVNALRYLHILILLARGQDLTLRLDYCAGRPNVALSEVSDEGAADGSLGRYDGGNGCCCCRCSRLKVHNDEYLRRPCHYGLHHTPGLLVVKESNKKKKQERRCQSVSLFFFHISFIQEQARHSSSGRGISPPDLIVHSASGMEANNIALALETGSSCLLVMVLLAEPVRRRPSCSHCLSYP